LLYLGPGFGERKKNHLREKRGGLHRRRQPPARLLRDEKKQRVRDILSDLAVLYPYKTNKKRI